MPDEPRQLVLSVNPNELALRMLEITNGFVRAPGSDVTSVLAALVQMNREAVEATLLVAQVACAYFHELIEDAANVAGAELSYTASSSPTLN